MGRFLIGVESEHLTFFGTDGDLEGLRRFEGNPAQDDGHDRLGVDPHTASVQLEVDPAGVPESGVLLHELIVGGEDVDIDIHDAFVVLELVPGYFSDLNLAKVDRTANIQ